MRPSDVARFYTRFREDAQTGCWQWIAHIADPNEYAKMRVSGRVVKAHRFAYEMLVGEVPEGLELDHLCRNRHCVNPKHLEPVTRRTNTLRGIGPTSVNAAKTECIHGHPFDAANTILRAHGRRGCRACGREATRRYYLRKKQGMP